MSKEIIKLKEFYKILTLITLLLPCVCGAPTSRSYWVFWYYSGDGDRSCGNYCYIVFSLVGLILLCICGCGCLRCYYIRKNYRAERLDSTMNTQQVFDQWEHDFQMAERQQQLNQQQLQYPPLAHVHDTQHVSVNVDVNTPPPSYDNNDTYNNTNTDLRNHALRREESNWSAYKAGKDFTRSNPPIEIRPPQEHLDHIKRLGGVKPWKFVPESSIIQLNIASVTNDANGHIVSFHARLDAMVQTNYPLLDMKYPSLPSNNVLSNDDKKQKDQKDQKNNRLTVNTSALNANYNNESSNNISPITVYSFRTYNSNLNLISPVSPNPPLPPSPTTTNINKNTITDDASTSTQPPPPPPSYTPQSFALQPPTDSWFYYFEITIRSNPNNNETTIAIGLATKPYPTFRLPGFNSHSVGYHSIEGKKFHNDGLTGNKYAEKWGEVGDVIGCGYYPETGQVFFTKNGEDMGIAYSHLRHIWFPTIGSDGVCSLKVNFGQEEFKYIKANGMSVAGIIPENIVNLNPIEEEGEINMVEIIS